MSSTNESTPICVLYMEDDLAQARIVQRRLQCNGYVVDLAHDGREGLAKYTAGSYDVLLVDQTMPGLDGLEVIRSLASQGPLPPTIVVTGTGNETTAVEAMKLGVADYVVKSMDGGFVNYLPTVIERALEKKRLARERTQADKALRQSEAKFRALADTAQDAIVMINDLGNITFWNRAAARIFEYTAEEVLGKSARDLLAASQYSRQHHNTFPTFQETRLSDALGKTVELQGIRKSGEEFPLDLSLSSFALAGKWNAVAVIRDASERKRIERELAHAQKLESIGQLAAGIAHEINTPTQFIGDNTHFLQEAFADIETLLGTFDRLLEAAKGKDVDHELLADVEAALREADTEYVMEEVPRAIQQSLEGVQRVATIVGAMKELAHPTTNQRHPIDLNRTIGNALTVSRNEWKYVAELNTEFDPNLPLVSCLPSEINQVVLNIVVNAAQAIAELVGDESESKGTITVGTRRDGPWAEIYVRDTGGGILEEIRSRVFDPFFTTKDVGKGTGQGLAITYSIVVEKHDGTITFQTEPGVGTTFIVRLPITGSTTSDQDAQADQLQTAG